MKTAVQKYTAVVGSGSYLPGRLVSNTELIADLATRNIITSDEWIRTRTGIRQRFLADPGTNTSDVATKAARIALKNSNVGPDELDLIIVATSTPDYVFPSCACLVQRDLGVKRGGAFDVQAACSGFVYAMATADCFIRSGSVRTVLVIGAEIFSRILDWNDRSTCVLFGDGAGAVILQGQEQPGILAAQLHADGEQEKILKMSGNIAYGGIAGDPFLRMDGQAVFRRAVMVLSRSAHDICSSAQIDLNVIDWVIPHQANIRILNSLVQKLNIPSSKLVITVDEHANVSAASIPLALDKARRGGQVKPGHLLLIQGVGGGFTWGSVLIRM